GGRGRYRRTRALHTRAAHAHSGHRKNPLELCTQAGAIQNCAATAFAALTQSAAAHAAATKKARFAPRFFQPCRAGLQPKCVVGARGFEPPTPASRTQYSTRVSYAPTNARVAVFSGLGKPRKSIILAKNRGVWKGASRQALSGPVPPRPRRPCGCIPAHRFPAPHGPPPRSRRRRAEWRRAPESVAPAYPLP